MPPSANNWNRCTRKWRNWREGNPRLKNSPEPAHSFLLMSTLSQQVIELIAKRKVEGTRLDQYLASQFTDHSRSVIQRVIEANAVLVNGKPGKASYKVRNGDQIQIRLPEP